MQLPCSQVCLRHGEPEEPTARSNFRAARNPQWRLARPAWSEIIHLGPQLQRIQYTAAEQQPHCQQEVRNRL